MNPNRIHPRQRIKLHLEALLGTDLHEHTATTELILNVEGIDKALAEMRDPLTVPEVAALSGKRAWWWEGFIFSSIIWATAIGLTLIYLA